jgi:hypothetical protein
MDLKGIENEGKDWIHLAQYTEKMRCFVTAVMKERVPKAWGIYWVAEKTFLVRKGRG